MTVDAQNPDCDGITSSQITASARVEVAHLHARADALDEVLLGDEVALAREVDGKAATGRGHSEGRNE